MHYFRGFYEPICQQMGLAASNSSSGLLIIIFVDLMGGSWMMQPGRSDSLTK